MTEKGSDAQLASIAAPHEVTAPVEHEQARIDEEEDRVLSTDPAGHEPGGAYPDPDTTPPGDPPEYDPTPPEEPS